MALRRNEKTGIWQIDLPEGPNGNPPRLQRSSFTTSKAQAKQLHDKLANERWQEAKLGNDRVVMWPEGAEFYLETKADNGTIEEARDMFRVLDAYLGGYGLRKITQNVVDEVGRRMRAERGIGAARWNRYASLIGTVLNLGASRGWCPRTSLRKETESGERGRWLTKDEADRLVAELEPTAPHIAVMVRFTLCTGLRQKNVKYLKWNQIAMDRAHAWVNPWQSKNKKPIAVPLNKEAMAILREQLGKHETWVFPFDHQGRRGHKVGPVVWPASGAWDKAVKRAGLGSANEAGEWEPNVIWHDLRRTWATWHAMSGTPMEVLMKLGGWSSLDIVIKHYAHFSPDHLATWAENIVPKDNGAPALRVVK